MSWGLTAVAGATVVSGVMSSRSARKASGQAAEASETQLAFEQEKYDDWTAVYGPIQENLANYYQNVTPEYYAAIGLEEFEKQYQTSLTRIEENLAQRGIDPSSGVAMSLEAQAELDAAETRAGIRRDAPRQAAEDQSRFLQIGLGQSPGSSISSTLAQRSQQASAASIAASQSAGQAITAAIPTIGMAVDAYSRRPVTPTATAPYYPANVPFAGEPYIDPNIGVV